MATGPKVTKLHASYIADALIPTKGAENRALRETVNFVIGLDGGPYRTLVADAAASMRSAMAAAASDPTNPYPGDEENTAQWVLDKKDK